MNSLVEGDVMAKRFSSITLGELVSFKTGKLDSNASTPTGKYPFFTCAQETYRTDTCSFDCECVLLAGNNAAGIYPLKYFTGKFDAYQRTYVIQSVDEARLSNRFLYFAMRPKLDHLKSISTGAATKFLTLALLKSLEVEYPPLETQHTIASILSAYDDLIENNTRRIKILEEMARLVYREWFVNFRFPGHEQVRMVDSPLGLIPEGWEVKALGEVCKVLPGYAFKSKDWQLSGIPVIKIKNISSDSTVNLQEIDCVPLEILTSKVEKYLLKNGDFLIAMTGATAGKVGKLRYKSQVLLNQRVAKIEPIKGVSEYIWNIITSEEYQKLLFNLADGAAQPNMSGSQIEGMEVVLPSQKIIDKFEHLVSPMSSEIDTLLLKNQNLRQTRDLLLPKLISGEIAV